MKEDAVVSIFRHQTHHNTNQTPMWKRIYGK